jgi:hypothetical protein
MDNDGYKGRNLKYNGKFLKVLYIKEVASTKEEPTLNYIEDKLFESFILIHSSKPKNTKPIEQSWPCL